MFIKSARTKIQGTLDAPALGALSEQPGSIRTASRFRAIDVDPSRFIYLDDWAVSAYERYGLNDNGDGFERDVLKRSYASFVNSWVCLDHDNEGADRSIGENVDAIYTPDDYVRVAMAIDRKRAEARHPGLESKIASKLITDTSMGALIRYSVCTVVKCANEASDESQFCKHVLARHLGGLRGMEICNADTNWVPTRCGEKNRDVNFFENSIITTSEGADNNAKILAALSIRTAACAARTGEVSVSAERLYKELVAMRRGASAVEKVAIIALTDRIAAML